MRKGVMAPFLIFFTPQDVPSLENLENLELLEISRTSRKLLTMNYNGGQQQGATGGGSVHLQAQGAGGWRAYGP